MLSSQIAWKMSKWHIEQSPVDLLIMGEDVGTHSLSSLLKFIKEIKFTNKILFIKDYGFWRNLIF